MSRPDWKPTWRKPVGILLLLRVPREQAPAHPLVLLQPQDLDSELPQFKSQLLASRFLAPRRFQELTLIEQSRRTQHHIVDLALLLLGASHRRTCIIVAKSIPQCPQRNPLPCIERLTLDALK